GSLGATQRPWIRTNVGRFVVEKKPSGRTPSAGAASNRASGAPANRGCEKSGGGKVVTAYNLAGCPRGRHGHYSSRNASIGSMRDARRAGRYAASSPTAAKTAVALVSTAGSVGPRPYRNDDSSRVVP